MQPTPEQLSIIDATATSPSSIMISAYAGTAKTTTLQLAAPGIHQPALALAFNRKIALELGPRLPSWFTTKTLNGLGHSVWARAIPGPIKLDDRKIGRLVTSISKDLKCPLTPSQWDATRHLVSAAMLAGLSPDNIGQPLLTDTPETWNDLYEGSADDFPLALDIAQAVLRASIDQARQGIISFDDQIYCPTILGGFWPQFPCVMIDESQDLSPLNHRMLQLCLRQDGRLIAVGDPKQCIYAFRGADHRSMTNMRHLSPSWSDLRLTMTFRCPHQIVSRQQSHAPGFTAWSGCPNGRFSNELEYDEDDVPGWDYKLIEGEMAGLPPNGGAVKTAQMAVLCRNNSPLLSLAFKLLRRNIGCQMLGREIGRSLVNLSRKLAPDDSLSIPQHLEKIKSWSDRECANARAADRPDRLERIRDQEECLYAVIDGSAARTAGDLRAALDNLFRRESGLVTLSTIHRAKGLEWDLVVHLDPWRVPSKRALQNPIQLEQERNLLYVCETRTKHTLLNLNLKDFR